jgi:hypothetical protein
MSAFWRFSVLAALSGYMSALPAQAEVASINVNKACASIVGITYASDNFSDEGWEQFRQCRKFLNQFQE